MYYYNAEAFFFEQPNFSGSLRAKVPTSTPNLANRLSQVLTLAELNCALIDNCFRPQTGSKVDKDDFRMGLSVSLIM